MRHALLSSDNSYCFQVYLVYLLNHLMDFQLICIMLFGQTKEAIQFLVTIIFKASWWYTVSLCPVPISPKLSFLHDIPGMKQDFD